MNLFNRTMLLRQFSSTDANSNNMIDFYRSVVQSTDLSEADWRKFRYWYVISKYLMHWYFKVPSNIKMILFGHISCCMYVSVPCISNSWYLKVNFLDPENLSLDISCLGWSSTPRATVSVFCINFTVWFKPARASQTIGYLYEFDCKPVTNVVGIDTTKWKAIAFEQQVCIIKFIIFYT